MIDINGLRNLILLNRLIGGTNKQYIDWAVSELLRDVDDIDVCLLASSNENNSDEINLYIRNILGKNIEFSTEEIQETTGRIIVDSGKKYFNKELSIIQIERIIDTLYTTVDYTDWLVVLSRNAEYATDIDYFLVPFENEVKYIMELWETYPKYHDFINYYDRDISNLNM